MEESISKLSKSKEEEKNRPKDCRIESYRRTMILPKPRNVDTVIVLNLLKMTLLLIFVNAKSR